MNEFLEQLVRDLTNAYSRSQKLFGERVSPGPTNQRSFLGLPCCWGTNAMRSDNPWSIWTVYALSLSLSACFLRTRFMMSSQGQGTISKRRGLIACVPNNDTNGKLLSPNHLWSLPAAPHSDLSARQYKGVIPGYDVRPSALQHVIRGCFRSFSATASLRHSTINRNLYQDYFE